MVYVISKKGFPLMPTKRSGKVRHLLKEGKAIIITYEPFTIQLLYDSSTYTQKVIVGEDTGSKKVGLAAITEKGKILYTAEVDLRQDIKENISIKKRLRKARRQRNTRYRPARFLNRKRKKGELAPSINARIYAHYVLVKKISQFLPVTRIVTEVGQFDVQSILNPDIEGTEYQNGVLKGYDSVKEYVKIRDKFTCHYRKLRQDITCDEKLVVDHIIPISKGGSDRPDNLVCSCKNHNTAKDNMSYKEFTGKKSPEIESFKETVFMNVIRDYLIQKLQTIAPTSITYGYYTRRKRKEWNLEKSHINDAIAITGIKPVEYTGNIYCIKQVRKKKRSLQEEIPRKGRSKPNIDSKRNRKNIKSIEHKGKKWCLWDKVYIPVLEKVGFISGFTGKWAYIQNIEGNYLLTTPKYRQINPDKIKLISRNNNYIIETNQRKDSSFIST